MIAETSQDAVRALVEDLFAPHGSQRAGTSVGAELELIPIRRASRTRVGIEDGAAGPGTAGVARRAGAANEWTETTDGYGAPSWLTPEGGRVCYEPGGQFEISSPVFTSANELEHFLSDTVQSLRAAATDSGISLLASGVDPYNDIDDVPAEIRAPRYDAMVRYLDTIGPSGRRMMRQTASLQVNVELGPDPLMRWALLNALAPYLTAAFANSPNYAGAATGYASYRALLWRTLDPTRTGIPFDASDSVGAYATFARRAGRIVDDDRGHLSTLFPEVRPRGYFELRSMDAMEPARAGDAIRFVCSLIHDEDVAAEVWSVIGPPDVMLLDRAALAGRSDPLLGQRLEILESIAAEV